MTKGGKQIPRKYWQGWLVEHREWVIGRYNKLYSIRQMCGMISSLTCGQRIGYETLRTYLHTWGVKMRSRGGDTRSGEKERREQEYDAEHGVFRHIDTRREAFKIRRGM